MENESTIEIRHNCACVKITRKEGRCYYSTSGQPTTACQGGRIP